jgi:hypothetical protein
MSRSKEEWEAIVEMRGNKKKKRPDECNDLPSGVIVWCFGLCDSLLWLKDPRSAEGGIFKQNLLHRT